MTLRSVFLLLLSVFAAIFLVLNWSGIMQPVPVNLLFTQSEAPLGLILLAIFGVLWAISMVWSLAQQAATLVEIRKAYKEAKQSRSLADTAEQSRFEQTKSVLHDDIDKVRTEVRACLEESVQQINASVHKQDEKLVNQQAQLELLIKTQALICQKLEIQMPQASAEAEVAPKRGFFSFFHAKDKREPTAVDVVALPKQEEPNKSPKEVETT